MGMLITTLIDICNQHLCVSLVMLFAYTINRKFLKMI